MAIITLTSDWGTSDYYAAAVKGVILSRMPNATIVDITHQIDPFNIAQAGFTLHNCFNIATMAIPAMIPEMVRILSILDSSSSSSS